MKKRQSEEEVTVQPAHPPPELPPVYQKQIGGSGKWLEVIVLWKKEKEFYFIVFLLYNFFDHTICFFFWYVFCCKTVNLDVGDGRIAVIVFGSVAPINGSASYIASVELVNSEFDSRV
ncbi:unnamed protein product, partial [Cuscuta epithymum]